MKGTGLVALVMSGAVCLGAVGCTTYNPATGQYETNAVATSTLAGGLGLAGGVALGAALADDHDHWGGYYGGGYHGGHGHNKNVYVNNNRYVNYNKKNYNRQNYNRANRNANWNRGGGSYKRGGGGGRRGGGRKR
jgi:hypothetical protein